MAALHSRNVNATDTGVAGRRVGGVAERVLVILLVLPLLLLLLLWSWRRAQSRPFIHEMSTPQTLVWQGDNVGGVAERVLVILLVLPLLLLLLLWSWRRAAIHEMSWALRV